MRLERKEEEGMIGGESVGTKAYRNAYVYIWCVFYRTFSLL